MDRVTGEEDEESSSDISNELPAKKLGKPEKDQNDNKSDDNNENTTNKPVNVDFEPIFSSNTEKQEQKNKIENDVYLDKFEKVVGIEIC
ncbi:MAG: hypothetical protein AB8G05_19580 [Oligoflexales bacterium]